MNVGKTGEIIASMRPRLLHLGYPLLCVQMHEKNKFASMRPRLLHLGYAGLASCFNRHISCFNEAEAFTPRIFRTPPSGSSGVRLASMRPRLLHLGYYLARGHLRHIIGGFNEAEAFTPRIFATCRRRSASATCFNEAEAFTPRISRDRPCRTARA